MSNLYSSNTRSIRSNQANVETLAAGRFDCEHFPSMIVSLAQQRIAVLVTQTNKQTNENEKLLFSNSFKAWLIFESALFLFFSFFKLYDLRSCVQGSCYFNKDLLVFFFARNVVAVSFAECNEISSFCD